MKNFKIVVAGGRHFNDYQLLSRYLDHVLGSKKETHNIVVVCGKAKGADSLGEKYAIERGYDVEEFPANWDMYGKRAGYLRNKQMGIAADAAVAFWDGVSKGTEHMINLMAELNKPCKVVKYG
jgi:hypothetical protein